MRRASIIFAGLLLAAPNLARAEPGSFFKNMFGGGGGGGEGGPSSITAPRAQDPDDVYCPPVFVPDGGAAVQAFAGAAGDNRRLRYQIGFGRLSRECKARPDGSVAVRVGVELRALLGPAGAAGRFEAPVTIAVKYNEQPIMARTHRVAVTVPAGAAQGEATVIENDLFVPADKALGYDIEVTLAGAAARTKPVARRRKPTPTAEAEQGEATAGQ
ncbi:hypothetical protein MPPM_0608 [Methylorubrum populi]|uniref:Uncharacterized protein n=1 Tax=Methylorubrum populi TaxID=223967 RepID=A0A160PBI1_9HYPH|nr:hypothetical protein [Methylorubrum populi]BAU89213.1 hypothetical protein MPPM_0608 [Methylorubrum populi]